MKLHQMIFIYNAVMAGWSVKRVESGGNFRFKKRVAGQRETYTQNGFLQRFVQNMQRLDAAPPRRAPSSNNLVGVETTTVSSFELPIDQDIVIPSPL